MKTACMLLQKKSHYKHNFKNGNELAMPHRPNVIINGGVSCEKWNITSSIVKDIFI